jgi:LAGLIDADG endonuclease
MSSENPTGADNQQERPDIEQWIVGFVDGEGCFSCPIQRNARMSRGWQLQPRFSVVQGERSVSVLELIREYFGCGRVYRNRRHDNHKEDLFRYDVHRWTELRSVIVPFFEANPLRTAKHQDFMKFKQVLQMMDRRMHLSIAGLREIAKVTQTMNHQKPSRFLESSEAIRQPALLGGGVEDMVRNRGDTGFPPVCIDGRNWKSEIPCRVSSDLHEWRNDLGTVSTRDSAKLQYE